MARRSFPGIFSAKNPPKMSNFLLRFGIFSRSGGRIVSISKMDYNNMKILFVILCKGNLIVKIDAHSIQFPYLS